MKSFLAFFFLFVFPIAAGAMVENTNEANVWYHTGFIVVFFLAVCIWGLVSEALEDR